MARMTRKSASRSEWENIQGFDRTKGEYIRLDGDAWLAAHQIPAEGARRGKRNQPSSDEKQPDAVYSKIESWVRKRALDCKAEVGKYISEELANLHDSRSFWEERNPEIDLDALVMQRCQDLHAKAKQSVSDLDKQRAEYEEAARDLKKFRQKHRLSQIADYPSSSVAHWLWVPVAGFAETFVSAYLLGSVSRGGVIEGWMIAVVLTFVNILLGIWAGRTWRSTHYSWGSKGFVKLFAYAQGAVSTAVAIVWNDVAGHVRDVYVLAEKTGALEAPDEAFATAYRTMIERPLPWESLPSAGLALVGIAVFVLTAYKAYKADDPFPGYGPRHRKAETLRGRYQDDLNDAREALESARNEANVAIDEIKSRYQLDRAAWESALVKLRMVVDQYPANLRAYNKDLDYLLAAYRSANLAERTTPAPHFFGTRPAIDEEVIRPPEFHVPDAPKWGDIPKKAEAGFARVEETYNELLSRYQMLDRVVDDYADNKS